MGLIERLWKMPEKKQFVSASLFFNIALIGAIVWMEMRYDRSQDKVFELEKEMDEVCAAKLNKQKAEYVDMANFFFDQLAEKYEREARTADSLTKEVKRLLLRTNKKFHQ